MESGLAAPVAFGPGQEGFFFAKIKPALKLRKNCKSSPKKSSLNFNHVFCLSCLSCPFCLASQSYLSYLSCLTSQWYFPPKVVAGSCCQLSLQITCLKSLNGRICWEVWGCTQASWRLSDPIWPRCEQIVYWWLNTNRNIIRCPKIACIFSLFSCNLYNSTSFY